MRRALFLTLACLSLYATPFAGSAPEPRAAFPRKPVTIIVYTAPGGLIDVTARKFSDVAARYTDATFVVENKPGAGGILAIREVLRRPADGHTIFACTKSNISKIVLASHAEPSSDSVDESPDDSPGALSVDDLEWIAMLMADPECVITKRTSSVRAWSELLADSRGRREEQIWVGPAIGGLDHVTGLKIWKESGIRAKWIPFKSGGKALAALLGDQGVAYVGNPRDTLNKPDLMIAAVSSPERLSLFPDVPTFRECGLKGLDKEIMWRGFAMRPGAPADVMAWYDDLFRKVTNDPEWRGFWEQGGIEVVYHGPGKFGETVRSDRAEFAHYLAEAGVITSDGPRWMRHVNTRGALLLFALLTAALGAAVHVLARRRPATVDPGALLVPILFLCLCVLFLLVSFSFPKGDAIGPSVVPRLWVAFLFPISAVLLVKACRAGPPPADESDTRGVLVSALLLLVYLAAMHIAGYYLSTAVFLPLFMARLGFRRLPVMAAVTAGWLLFSYLFFARLLYVPLPEGILFTALL